MGVLGDLVGEVTGFGQRWAELHILDGDTTILILGGSERTVVRLDKQSPQEAIESIRAGLGGATHYVMYQSAGWQGGGAWEHGKSASMRCDCRRLKKTGRADEPSAATELYNYVSAFGRW